MILNITTFSDFQAYQQKNFELGLLTIIKTKGTNELIIIKKNIEVEYDVV